MASITSPKKLQRKAALRKKALATVHYQYTTSFYIYALLRWFNAKRLARMLFNDQTVAALVFHKATGKQVGVTTIRNARILVHTQPITHTPLA